MKYRHSNYFTLELINVYEYYTLTMAGNLTLVVFLFAFCTVFGFEINSHECQTNAMNTALKCNWRGKGNYVASAPVLQEIIIFNKMSSGAYLIVPMKFKENLVKIKTENGDAPCSDIIVPNTVNVYIDKQRCVSKLFINL